MSDSDMTEEKRKKKVSGKKVLKELFSTAIYILVIFAVTFLLIKYVGQRTVVDGRSMENTLQDGDSLWVDKITYRFADPKRFDIVVFPPDASNPTNYYIKRIIGLPGETVYIDEEGNIYIDGEILEESYGKEVIDSDHRGRAAEYITLGSDEYFVMGDNRNNSLDSRFSSVGNVKRSQIIGKAVFRLYPFSSIGNLQKRK